MKKTSKKTIIVLVVALTTMLAMSVATFASWQYSHWNGYAGSTGIQLCVGYDDYEYNYTNYVGYAEVSANDNCYASMSGWARYLYNGSYNYSYIVGSMDDNTYRQIRVTGKNYINKISCDFTVIADDGVCRQTLTK